MLKGMVPAVISRLSMGKSPASKEKAGEEKGRRGVRTTRAKPAAGETAKGRVATGRTRAAKTAVTVAAPVTPKRRRGALVSLIRVRAVTDGLR